jgi:hypothetical protein
LRLPAHLSRDVMHGAVSHPDSTGDLPNASAGRERSPYSGDLLRRHFGRPIAFPLLVPCARALAMPARTRCTIIARSNSANTPSI